MKQHELKLIKRELQFGDISTIARECKVSTMTVHNALNGVAITDTAKLIIEHAKTIIQQRKNRIIELEIKKIKKTKQPKHNDDQTNI
jgi:hypothetical protein